MRLCYLGTLFVLLNICTVESSESDPVETGGVAGPDGETDPSTKLLMPPRQRPLSSVPRRDVTMRYKLRRVLWGATYVFIFASGQFYKLKKRIPTCFGATQPCQGALQP